VLFDLARGQAACIERDHGFAEIANRALAFGHDLGLEAAVAIARRFHLDFAEIAAYRLGRGTVTRVAATAALRVVFGVA
jgi:hypothetical protein